MTDFLRYSWSRGLWIVYKTGNILMNTVFPSAFNWALKVSSNIAFPSAFNLAPSLLTEITIAHTFVTLFRYTQSIIANQKLIFLYKWKSFRWARISPKESDRANGKASGNAVFCWQSSLHDSSVTRQFEYHMFKKMTPSPACRLAHLHRPSVPQCTTLNTWWRSILYCVSRGNCKVILLHCNASVVKTSESGRDRRSRTPHSRSSFLMALLINIS